MMKGVSHLKILFVCMRHAYGQKEREDSYEWCHFYLGTKTAFSEVKFFDFLAKSQELGREGMQSELDALIDAYQPDVTVFSLYQNEFDPLFIQKLTEKTKTLCFFHDDSWRIDFTLQWANHFSAFTTSDFSKLDHYHTNNLQSAVYMPFGVNEQLFCVSDVEIRDIDVSFVGAWHPYRQWLLRQLQKSGITVAVFGHGWPTGPISTVDMVKVFQRSKMSLNLSNSASYDARYLLSHPRALINTLRTNKIGEQIKGRHFELPACGAMQISYSVSGIEKLYDVGREIEVFASPEELVKLIQWYLKHDDDRNAVAQSGLERTLKDHTYSQRFKQAFAYLGWCSESFD